MLGLSRSLKGLLTIADIQILDILVLLFIPSLNRCPLSAFASPDIH